MNIKIHSSELNRMMKTITQCIDTKDITNRANIEIIWDNNLLSIRACNGQFAAIMSTPLLGGNGESFCVDGAMFARVCAMCNGEIQISTDEKTCTVRGAGRTRLPIIGAKIPAYEHVTGKSTVISAEQFSACYGGVAYAISADQARIQLTGVNMVTDSTLMNMIALDGFQMSVDYANCEGDAIDAIVPGAFMKLIAQSAVNGEDITLRTNGQRLEALTDSMMLNCGLISGEYPDWERILPKDFKTTCLVKAEELRNALKSGSVVNNKQNLVKLEVGESVLKVMNNSEEADYEAEVSCMTQGEPLKIAFNQKYLMNTINSIDTEEITLKFGTSVSPCVAQGRGESGIIYGNRLVLPVRVMG